MAEQPPVPPPIPSIPKGLPQGKPLEKSTAHYLAAASWVLPIVVVALCLAFAGIFSELPKDPTGTKGMILVLAAFLLFLIGTLLGVFGLVGVEKYGRRGLFGPALAGTIINGIFVIVGVTAVLWKGAAVFQSNLEIAQKRVELNAAMQKDLANGGTNRALTQEKLDALQKSLENAAQDQSGDRALELRAAAAYLASVNSLKRKLDAATAGLLNAKILSPKNLTGKEQLENQREVVQRFLAANDETRTFYRHGADNYQAAMDKFNIPKEKAELELRGYRSTADALNPITVKIRDFEEFAATAMLDIVNLEEDNWPNLTVNPKTGRLILPTAALVKRYNADIAQIRQATADEKEDQAKILAISKNSVHPQ